MEEKIDLGWGDPYFLLEILSWKYRPVLGNGPDIKSLTYEADLGNPNLIHYCRELTKKMTGREYKHIVITNGATQAINSIMRVWAREMKLRYCVTGELGYPFYPHMIKQNALLWHKKVDLKHYKGDITDEMFIIDSPSNPLGEQFHYSPTRQLLFNRTNVIWDAVYHNKIYNACPAIQPGHDVFVGSFSKLLGLTGARVGWVATNHKHDFDLISKDSLYENATVSKVSQSLVQDILEKVDIDEFMTLGKNSLDQNRNELQKLSNITKQDVQEKGMFYCFEVDDKLINLFDRANVKYVVFNHEEDDQSIIRLNIGQTNDILKKAVKSVQKADRSK